MIIKSLTASFGKLENDTLELNDGLNVICSPNESGKSTWTAFICSMLYGVDSTERAKAGSLPDKTKYLPWSGAPMEGRMELISGGRDITLTRSTKSKNAPMREFSASYTGTNERVGKLTSQNAGELLTGVSRDVFRRTAFVQQRSLSFGGSAELEKRINAIVSTGEEHSSYSEADDRLREWQRRRRNSRGGGILPELESSIKKADSTLKSMSGLTGEQAERERLIKETRERLDSLSDQRRDLRQKLRRQLNDGYNSTAKELKHCEDAYENAKLASSRNQLMMEQSHFYGQESDKLNREAAEDANRAQTYKKLRKIKASVLLPMLLMILAVVCTSIYISKRLIPLIMCAALFCIAGMALLFRSMKLRRQRMQALDNYSELLNKYHVQTPEAITETAAKYAKLCTDWRASALEEQSALDALETAKGSQEKLNDAIREDYSFNDAPPKAVDLGRDYVADWERHRELNRQLARAQSDVQELERQCSHINGQLTAIGDPLVLASELESMREEHEHVQAEYDALTLALDTLREADGELQGRFSPQLGTLAAKYMAEITEGKYTEVLINRDFSACARTEDDVIAHQSEYLSAGTVDLLYLCVRLAVCELALPEGEPCPLIIDDALVNFDDERSAQAMKLLKKLSQKRQVVLFTCRGDIREND